MYFDSAKEASETLGLRNS